MPDFGQNTITNRQAVLDIIDNSITEAVNTSKDFIYLVTQTADEQSPVVIEDDGYVPFLLSLSNGITLNVDTITISKSGFYKFAISNYSQMQDALLVEINGNIILGFTLQVNAAVSAFFSHIQQLSSGDEVKIIYKDINDIGNFTLGAQNLFENSNFLPGLTLIIEQL